MVSDFKVFRHQFLVKVLLRGGKVTGLHTVGRPSSTGSPQLMITFWDRHQDGDDGDRHHEDIEH